MPLPDLRGRDVAALCGRLRDAIAEMVFVAVGSQGPDNSLTLAEAWNGVTWRVTPTPSLPPGSQLDAVSCTGARCLAIGFAFLSEVWNGATWRVVTIQLPCAVLLRRADRCLVR